MNNISADEVRGRVREFWRLFSGKEASGFAEMYFPHATALETDAKRVEPGRLMLERRTRELFSDKGSVDAELGTIDVQSLDEGVAVATYNFHFYVTRNMAGGKRLMWDLPDMRCTQVFQRDEKGTLRIIHEHFSSGVNPTPKELPSLPATK